MPRRLNATRTARHRHRHHAARLGSARLGSTFPSDGQWWGAWILDQSTGTDTHIGSLAVGQARLVVGTAATATQYFGSATTCARLPGSRPAWSAPTGNGNSDNAGTGLVTSSFAGGNSPGCGSSVAAGTYRGTSGGLITLSG
ncbi:hypothetical protein [Pseudofrankia sp. BMG5.37]|uniref:hypothetical protein n=1 Tax=Pseudofrankia sp. BMG5.37 TaxID=3050035 RepID=UPI002894D700|nr:hypothetical protein [Pseudofrankia sp. BMG5.37]MDT3446411.1 hypothetical protein [Pseudofrankia sp. BMG5.37]